MDCSDACPRPTQALRLRQGAPRFLLRASQAAWHLHAYMWGKSRANNNCTLDTRPRVASTVPPLLKGMPRDREFISAFLSAAHRPGNQMPAHFRHDHLNATLPGPLQTGLAVSAQPNSLTSPSQRRKPPSRPLNYNERPFFHQYRPRHS